MDGPSYVTNHLILACADILRQIREPGIVFLPILPTAAHTFAVSDRTKHYVPLPVRYRWANWEVSLLSSFSFHGETYFLLSYWYHSHLSTQYCDGLRGAFIVYGTSYTVSKDDR